MSPASRLLRHPLGLLLALQIGWWAAVGGTALGLAWLGPLVIPVLIVLQLRASAPAEARATAALVPVLAVAGTAADSLQSAAGLLSFEGAVAPWVAPLWITALWAHFATALAPLDRLLARRDWAIAATGAIGGPLAYLGGAELGAATLHPAVWPTVVALAFEWGIALPLACRAHRWLLAESGDPSLQPESA